jgi:hypothetical protein
VPRPRGGKGTSGGAGARARRRPVARATTAITPAAMPRAPPGPLAGITEAFVHAVLDAAALQRANLVLVALSATHVAASLALVSAGGAVGLVAADGLNMALRIAYSLWCARRRRAKGGDKLAAARGEARPRGRCLGTLQPTFRNNAARPRCRHSCCHATPRLDASPHVRTPPLRRAAGWSAATLQPTAASGCRSCCPAGARLRRARARPRPRRPRSASRSAGAAAAAALAAARCRCGSWARTSPRAARCWARWARPRGARSAPRCHSCWSCAARGEAQRQRRHRWRRQGRRPWRALGAVSAARARARARCAGGGRRNPEGRE